MKNGNKEFKIIRLRREDSLILRKLVHLFQEVFEMKKREPVKKSYLKTLLQNSNFIACVVIHKNKIVGGLTAFELPLYYSASSEVFIYDLAISPEFQRKGLGKKLLTSLKKYCKQKGIPEIFVAANKEDKHAINFYQSTGGKSEKVIHFNYSSET